MTIQEISNTLNSWKDEMGMSYAHMAYLSGVTPDLIYKAAARRNPRASEVTQAALEEFIRKGEIAWQIFQQPKINE